MSKLKKLLIVWVVITFVPGLFVAACVSFIEMDISLVNPYYWTQGARVAFCGYAAMTAVAMMAALMECYD